MKSNTWMVDPAEWSSKEWATILFFFLLRFVPAPKNTRKRWSNTISSYKEEMLKKHQTENWMRVHK